MFEKLSLFPPSASDAAGQVDAIFFFLVAVSVFFILLIAGCLFFFSVRYRRARKPVADAIEGSTALEMFWTAVPLAIALGSFAWGAKLFHHLRTPPREGMDFLVTGKQWMWKIQHPTGQREINSLHVPRGETIKLTLTSEDVIHDFFVPAFRTKVDVLPGAYTTLWFRPTKTGTYRLFCAEYCGTKHSEMIGSVVVLDPQEYARWLSGQPAGRDPVAAGRVLFENMRCDTCHSASSGARGPDLSGRFGTHVRLADGRAVLFDETYARESLLEPRKHVVAGYEPLMPTYEGQLSEDQIHQLVAYLKSLRGGEEGR